MIHQPHCNRIICESNNTALKDLVVWFDWGVNMDAFFQFYIKEGFLLPGALPWALGFHSQMKPQIHCLQEVRGSGAAYSSPKGSLRDGELQFFMCSFYKHLNDFALKLWGSNAKILASGLTWNQFLVCLKICQPSTEQCSLAEIQIPTKILKAELFQQFSGL